jgi:hypothetical protein
LEINNVPMPDPVPPPKEWHTWKPAKREARIKEKHRHIERERTSSCHTQNPLRQEHTRQPTMYKTSQETSKGRRNLPKKLSMSKQRNAQNKTENPHNPRSGLLSKPHLGRAFGLLM